MKANKLIEKLKEVALKSKSSDEFIGKIQAAVVNRKDSSLLDAVYAFEKTNAAKYKDWGWFRIATDFFDQVKKKNAK